MPARFFFWIINRLDAQRFALPALGRGRRSRPTGKMIRRRKLPEIAAESPASGARFVGQFFILHETLFLTIQFLIRFRTFQELFFSCQMTTHCEGVQT